MDRATVLARLKASERELREMGIAHLSIFGSVARGEERADSDVDLVARLDPAFRIGLFRYIEINDWIADVLGRSVDLVTEPCENPRLQTRIDRDRVHVF